MKKSPTIFELLPYELQERNVQPVGRLDLDTTGLLILTDDGDLIHSLTSPKKGKKKVYVVECKHDLKEEDADSCGMPPYSLCLSPSDVSYFSSSSRGLCPPFRSLSLSLTVLSLFLYSFFFFLSPPLSIPNPLPSSSSPVRSTLHPQAAQRCHPQGRAKRGSQGSRGC